MYAGGATESWVERSDRQQKLAGLAAKMTFAKELMVRIFQANCLPAVCISRARATRLDELSSHLKGGFGVLGKGAKKKLKPKETAGDMPVFKWRLERKK